MISARKVQLASKYKSWRNFNSLISRAKNLIANGIEVGEIKESQYIRQIGSGATRVLNDYVLDNNAENLVKNLALSYKLGNSFSKRNETSILTLLKKYCEYKKYSYNFQFRLQGFFYDFRCENILIEFDEPHHQDKKQIKKDFKKDEIASENNYTLLRFTLENDIIDMIIKIEESRYGHG